MPGTTDTAASSKPVDLFKPLYKRDKRLAQPTDSLEILDCARTVAEAQANGRGEAKVGGYTVRVQEYRLVGEATGRDETKEQMQKIFQGVAAGSRDEGYEVPPVLTVDGLPGLQIIPQFLPIQVQARLVENIIEDLIPDPQHLSNLDTHYLDPHPRMRYLFDEGQVHDPEHALQPRDPALHAPLTLDAVRAKKLRWITLGGQYNWTTKVYPTFSKGAPGFPQFPPTVGSLFGRPLFGLVPEAAIVNFYAPGDTLSPHQDVAELSKADLVSMSIGCDAVFYAGLDRYDDGGKDEGVKPPLQIRVRSGDVIVMGGEARQAFHGVGRVWDASAPRELLDAVDPKYADWLSHKRINFNVRQMLM